MRRLIANDVPLWIRAIPLEDMSMVVFDDAILANTKGGSAQIGHLVCACEKRSTLAKELKSVCSFTSPTRTIERQPPPS